MIWQERPVGLEEFVEVATRHLGEMQGQSVREAAQSLVGEGTPANWPLSTEDAGRLLTTAMIPLLRPGLEQPLDLTWAAVVVGGDQVRLPPVSAQAHPLLQPWLAPTVQSWVSWQLASGAFLYHAGPTAPTEALEIRDEAGRLGASVVARFPNGATAVLSYGQDELPDILACKVAVSAARLWAIGADLRNLTQAPAPGPDHREDEDLDRSADHAGAESAAAVRH